jgi:hypothetical protein
MKFRYFTLCIVLTFFISCGKEESNEIDLSGSWTFKIDTLDQGIGEKWFGKDFTEIIQLPGSMAENDKGNDVTVHTEWTGKIVDTTWFSDEKYAKYRKEGNVKIPFWLQPEKHYIGAAWYQKEIKIPTEWSGKHIKLTLERPHWETQVWVDDQHIGMQNSLGTAHIYDLTNFLKTGKNIISIRVDNRVKDVHPGENSHSISDHTQSNWNGIVGKITLNATAPVIIDNVKLYPDVENKKVRLLTQVKNFSGKAQKCQLVVKAVGLGENNHSHEQVVQEIEVDTDGQFEIDYPMGESFLLWDEFNPNLYTMELSLKSLSGTYNEKVDFGMREFKVEGKRFTINDRPVFLRGTLECAIFPKTGYPATDIAEWKRILNICKDHGLNHMRFHSWCPPEAAFKAADELGVYLQVEASSWANGKGSNLGDGNAIDEWLYKEAEDILEVYGNHPSFVMMAYGNEPGGKNQNEYLRKFVGHFKAKDSRRVYTGGAGWPFLENLDYYNNHGGRIQGWGQELKSIINSEPPQTLFDFRDTIQNTPMPYVSHEIGQWCVYPNFKEIEKYTGVLKAKNFEIFQETLGENHMGHLADSLLLASGKLQALCYKADIEAALRTKDFAGFQLLDLHDFPGQGTALVGVLDPFWEEKGYISPEEYKRFCNETVPLARLKKRVFHNNEILEASIEVAHFGEKAMENPACSWELANGSGKVVAQGSFSRSAIALDNGLKLGDIGVDLSGMEKAQKLTLTVKVTDFSNSWDVWVYPSIKEKIGDSEQIRIVDKLDTNTISFLKNGGKVLLNIDKGSVKPEKGGDIGIGFSSIFWNTAWTRGQKPHTLGILCNPVHPALSEFPTEYHSNWQWWDAMSHSNAIVLDEFSPELNPIVRVIDDWFKNRRLALVFEAKVGKGKLIVSGIDLHSNLKNRPEAQQLLYSLKKYMASVEFDPAVELDANSIKGLFVNN